MLHASSVKGEKEKVGQGQHESEEMLLNGIQACNGGHIVDKGEGVLVMLDGKMLKQKRKVWNGEQR